MYHPAIKSYYIDIVDIRPGDEVVLMNQRLVFKVTTIQNQPHQTLPEITLQGNQLRFWSVFWEEGTITLPADIRALLVDRP